MIIRVTHVGTATVILEIGSIRILTDPAFDAAGTSYAWAPIGGSSTKLESPALAADAVGSFDVALVTHAQHDDNLDPSGRAVLARAGRVITTRPSARRIGGSAEGLREWESTQVVGRDGFTITITATPARHGPPLSLPFVGKVIGFVLAWEGQQRGALYISGDTVAFGGIAEIARRFTIGIAMLHLGQAKLSIAGPFRLTMDGAQGARVGKLLAAHTIVPIHYDGWTHFSEPQAHAAAAFEAAGLADRVRWLPKGTAVDLEA
jgi:L-ascorbate metabolism protein UlaG (beta-lactamase superfamily)